MTCTRSMATRVWRRLPHRNLTWKDETAGLSSWKCYEIGARSPKVWEVSTLCWRVFTGMSLVKTLSLVGGKQRGCERLKGSRKGIRRKKYRARWQWASGSEGCEPAKTSAISRKGLSCIFTTRNGGGKHLMFFFFWEVLRISIEETSSWKTDVFSRSSGTCAVLAYFADGETGSHS